jgi:putative transposase
MGKPYSMDLRERVVAAVETGGLSCHQAAAQFGVGVSTAIVWVRRLRETGSVAPGQMGGHKPKAISGEYRAWLLERTRQGTSPYAGLSPNSPSEASRSIIGRSGTSSTPRS